MKSRSGSMVLFFALALVPLQMVAQQAQAQSTYFTNRGCVDCHVPPTVATCNGCHYHGNRSLKATTAKTSYSPGETVSVTLTTGSTRSGWIKAILYDQTGAQVAASSGNASGMGGSTTFPATLTAPAPTTPGNYTWKMAYFGNSANNGDVHGEVVVNTNQFSVAAAADTTAPKVSSFTIPSTASGLTVPVSDFTATDDVGVTGYMITTSQTPPSASAAGWSASPPTSITAVAGANTFYAWTKDAAGNISAGKSASVTVNIPDTTPPTVGTFTLPATATGLTVPVSALTATDDVGVTGYMITKNSTAPAASAAGWNAAAPANVTATEGDNTFYAWARDAAGNISQPKSATVAVTPAAAEDTVKPALTVSTLATGAYTNKPTLNVSGTATDEGGIQSVTVNGQPAALAADGSFSTALNLVPGENTITVVAADKSGNQQTESRTITYDPTAPVLTLTFPADNGSTTQSFIALAGTVSEPATVTVKDNAGTPVTASMDGNNFTATVNLVPGVNTISISAADLAGNVVNQKRSVTYSSGAALNLSVTSPKEDVTIRKPELVLKGTITEGVGEIRVKISKGGESICPAVRDGNFSQKLTFGKYGVHPITILAADAAGNRSTVTRNVIYCPEKKKNDRQGERDRQRRMDVEEEYGDDRGRDDGD